jgi:hypothetical protein
LEKKMGLAIGRFIVDTHVHAQRHAFKFKERGIKPNWATLAEGMPDVEVYDNTPRLLYDMERYGVDVCVIMPAFGMTDELNVEIMKANPDKFVSLCNGSAYMKKLRRGEVEWSIEAMCEELDRLLGTGLYVGIGRVLGEWGNPSLAHDIAAAYPDVPLIMDHGGMQGWWSEMYMDATLQVAASHRNVYLETGLFIGLSSMRNRFVTLI